jgi:hypothetical protein
MTGYELGLEGERFVASLLYRAGLTVEMGESSDLLVEGVPVEVKAARPSNRGRGRQPEYQFSLRRIRRNGDHKTDHRKSALVVLLCYFSDDYDPVAFVIPSTRLGDRKMVKITSSLPWVYAGQWAKYLNDWDQLVWILGENGKE